MYYKYKKSMHKESLAVRAGSVRPRGLAGSIKKVCTKTKKKGQKKTEKEG